MTYHHHHISVDVYFVMALPFSLHPLHVLLFVMDVHEHMGGSGIMWSQSLSIAYRHSAIKMSQWM